MSVLSLLANILKNFYSHKLEDEEEMFVQQIIIFHLATGCVRLQDCNSSVIVYSLLCPLHFVIMYAVMFLSCVHKKDFFGVGSWCLCVLSRPASPASQ